MSIYPTFQQKERDSRMDERVKALRRVCRSRWFSSLSREELKLYLLLLVSTVRMGQEGQIPWVVLQRGLGASLTIEKVERLAQALRRYGLAHLHLIGSSRRPRRQRGETKIEIRFTVLRFKRLRGQASKDSERQGDGRDG